MEDFISSLNYMNNPLPDDIAIEFHQKLNDLCNFFKWVKLNINEFSTETHKKTEDLIDFYIK